MVYYVLHELNGIKGVAPVGRSNWPQNPQKYVTDNGTDALVKKRMSCSTYFSLSLMPFLIVFKGKFL